jgi:hypothetical protein
MKPTHLTTDKKSSKRCTQCKKKLGVMEYRCKCEKLFCISHLQPQEHMCTFDYKADASQLLTKQMVVGQLSSKLDPI